MVDSADVCVFSFFTGILCVFTILPALLLFFLGYEPRDSFNQNSIQTQCFINQQIITESTSSWSSRYICWDGLIDVNFIDNYGQEQTGLVTVYDCLSESDIMEKFVFNYKVNTTVDCYYNYVLYDLKIDLYNTQPYLASGIFFVVLFVIITGLFVAYNCRHEYKIYRKRKLEKIIELQKQQNKNNKTENNPNSVHVITTHNEEYFNSSSSDSS